MKGRNRFYALWKRNADEYDMYELAHDIKPLITFPQFDKAWQFLCILHENKQYAWEQFQSAVNQAY